MVEEVVDDVQESLEGAILVVVSNRDEGHGNASRETHSVLDVEVLVRKWFFRPEKRVQEVIKLTASIPARIPI